VKLMIDDLVPKPDHRPHAPFPLVCSEGVKTK
jgi:hypothetical protein